jgi:hypothetical protein
MPEKKKVISGRRWWAEMLPTVKRGIQVRADG